MLMPSKHKLAKFWFQVANGQKDAYLFIEAWNNYCHRVDDLVDTGLKDGEQIGALMNLTMSIYSSNFYQANIGRLMPIVTLIRNAYLDSVIWEKSNLLWQREYADKLRAYGNEMLIAVAEIAGGYEHMRKMSLKIRSLSYFFHHNKEGESI